MNYTITFTSTYDFELTAAGEFYYKGNLASIPFDRNIELWGMHGVATITRDMLLIARNKYLFREQLKQILKD
jgi:hypothetical protein